MELEKWAERKIAVAMSCMVVVDELSGAKSNGGRPFELG